jgi:hypothetical protein
MLKVEKMQNFVDLLQSIVKCAIVTPRDARSDNRGAQTAG